VFAQLKRKIQRHHVPIDCGTPPLRRESNTAALPVQGGGLQFAAGTGENFDHVILPVGMAFGLRKLISSTRISSLLSLFMQVPVNMVARVGGKNTTVEETVLKKLLTGGLAAGAMTVPLAGLAWADPTPNPNPPAVPGANGQGLVNANPPAAPEANGQGPTIAGAPAVPGSNEQGPTCVVSTNTPAQAAPGTDWRQVATLQGSVASDLGLPPGQVVNVFCTPTGAQNPSTTQPAGLANPGQPGTENPGQPGPLNPPPPQGQTGPQNPAAGQQ
jgi:hypothetical protein